MQTAVLFEHPIHDRGGYAMAMRLKPIASDADYEAARAERKLLWGSKLGTPDGNRLDELERMLAAYEKVRKLSGTEKKG